MFKNLVNFKVIIIGDREVGKRTFIIESLKASTLNNGLRATVGATFQTKVIKMGGKKINLRIWNLSADERFELLIPQFIKDSSAAILMYDITNLKTFNYLAKFPHIIRDNAGDIPIILVGNKLDLDKEREILTEKSLIFAKKNDLSNFIEISSKTGKNIGELVEVLTNYLLKRYPLPL